MEPIDPRRLKRDRPGGPKPPRREGGGHPRPERSSSRPPLTVFVTTLWEYPSQHYDAFVDERGQVVASKHAGRDARRAMQGDKAYEGATPSWVIWQCLRRWTRPGDRVLDPMCGSGTTLDVCEDLGRVGLGFDLGPTRETITRADARSLPVPSGSIDLVFIDPPYSTHVDYTGDEACIGRLTAGGEDDGAAYYEAMQRVIDQATRVLRPGGHLCVYVSDSFKKKRGKPGGRFMPIGLQLFAMMTQDLEGVEIIAVARKNEKLERGNWRKAAEEGNFFLRGFNYLLVAMKPVVQRGVGR